MNDRLQHLTEREKAALDDFLTRLEKEYAGQVRDIILFGSKARGDGHPDSDIDLLVVLENPTREQTDRVYDITYDILLERGINLAALTFSREEARRLQDLGTPLMRNVAEEGIVLKGEAIVVGEGKPQEVARNFMESARERLRAARLMRDEGLFGATMSLAFYAFLDAADAALAARRIRTKSHEGTISLFGLHFIKAGLVDEKYSAWFKRARKFRLQADYERKRDFSSEDAREAIAQATEFVETIEKLLPSLWEEPA